MGFAMQYITRPGIGYGGFMVNDGSNTTFIPSTSANSTPTLYKWIGNGDMARGRALSTGSECLSMPSVTLNPAQYNSLIGTLSDYKVISFKGC
jgi:hypothetical protein